MYQVLARKYRPRNFNQLVGQTHVSKALTSALERNRLHHAYLFTGTRGVGKTTIARILSKCLNCETGITATPCEVCATCVAINQGRFIDLIEIDAASRTKVEDTRELLDNVPYAPTQGRYKVYLIDEVHMLSTHSFNALLKTLEEPPEHVKFLLATTDPQKLPITVLSRCLQFTLRPLQQQEIHDHLQDILAQEQIGYDDKALWQLAEAAQGSLRDALSLTDQAIAYGQGQLQGSDIQDMLGLLDKGQIVHLLQSIYQSNGQHVSQILQNLSNQAVDLKAVLDQLITLLHQLALLQVLPQVPLQGTQEYQQQLHQLARQIDTTDIQLYYQIALQGRQDLKLAVSLQQGFDMCILRMLAFKPLSPNYQVLNEPGTDTHSTHQTTQEATGNKSFTVESIPAQQSINQPAPERPRLDSLQLQNQNHQHPSPAHHLEKNSHILDNQSAEPLFVDMAEWPPQTAQSQEADINYQPKVMLPDEVVTPTLAEMHAPSALKDVVKQDVAEQDVAEPLTVGEITTEQDAREASQALDLFGQPFTEVEVTTHKQADELAPQASAQADLTSKPLPKADVAPVQAEVEPAPLTTPLTHSQATVDAKNNLDVLLPQQILQHATVELTGQWNIEKWERWLREAEISPAIRNLAQHGLMRGEIGQTASFVIAPEHRLMATELIDGLIAALKQQWPDSRVELIFERIDEPLPLHLKEIRREKALQQADALLRREPAIQPLIEQFSAVLTTVSLKE